MDRDTQNLLHLISPTDAEAQEAFAVIERYTERKLNALEQAEKERDAQTDRAIKHHTEQMARLERIWRGVQSIQNDLLRFMPAVESVFSLTAQTASDQILMHGRLEQVEKTVENLRERFDEWRDSVE